MTRIRNYFNDFFFKRSDKRLIHLKINLKFVIAMTALKNKNL